MLLDNYSRWCSGESIGVSKQTDLKRNSKIDIIDREKGRETVCSFPRPVCKKRLDRLRPQHTADPVCDGSMGRGNLVVMVTMLFADVSAASTKCLLFSS